MFWAKVKRVVLIVCAGVLLCAPFVLATVSETYSPVKYTANSNLTSFSFTFKVFNATDLDVDLVNITSLNATNQTYGSNYTVALSTSTTGGYVNFTTAPASGNYVYISRNMNTTQTADIPSGGLFRESQIENALDRTVMLIQQQKEAIDRAILQNPYGNNTTTVIFPIAEANKTIGWDSTGKGLTNYNNSASAVTDAQAAKTSAEAAATNASASATNASASKVAALAAQAAAEAAAAGVNMPNITAGDAGKILTVNATEDGFTFANTSDFVTIVGNETVTGNKNFTGKISFNVSAAGGILTDNGVSYVPLATGTAGQILTANGAGKNLTWNTTAASGSGDMNYSDARVKVGTFYNVTQANTTQNITGVGFTPKAVIFLTAGGAASSPTTLGTGFDSNGTAYFIGDRYSEGGPFYRTGYSIYYADNASCTQNYTGKVISFHSDGFVVQWNRTEPDGGFTAGINVSYMAYR